MHPGSAGNLGSTQAPSLTPSRGAELQALLGVVTEGP